MTESLTVAWEGLPALPLAEDVDPQVLIANGELLERSQKHTRPGARLGAAWNTLEIGLATQSLTVVNEAIERFRGLSEHPTFDLGKVYFLDARIALAYAPLFRSRVQADPITQSGIERVYGAIGSLLEEVVEVGSDGGPIDGRISDLIVDGALLRTRNTSRLPYPSSHREEKCTDGTLSGHNRYMILGSNQRRKKFPMLIRRNRPVFREETIGAKGKPHESVSIVPLGQIISGTLHRMPDLRQMAHRLTPKAPPLMAQTRYAARLLVLESRGEILSPQQREALTLIREKITNLCLGERPDTTYRKPGEPLTHGVADFWREGGIEAEAAE